MPAESYIYEDGDEEAELEFLRESLEQMDNLTDKTTQLLKVFDIRLKNLGRIIAPIYKSTQKLTRLYDNIEATMGTLDDILLFFNVAKDEAATIHAGPDESELLPYLDSINRLKDASDALRQLDLESAAQSRKEIHELLRIGLGNLSQLFNQWLKQHSGGIDPAAYVNASEIPTFPTDTLKLLSMLATYLNLVNDEVSYDLRLTKTYATIRTRHLQKSLAQFSEMCSMYVRGNSLEPLPNQHGYDVASRNSLAEIRFCTIRNENWYEPSTSPFAQYTINIVKLFQAERDLVRHIMPTVISDETFFATTERPFEAYIAIGEKIMAFFFSSPMYEVLHALDVYGYLLETESVMAALLAPNKNQSANMAKMAGRLQAHLTKSFVALTVLLRSPFKEDTMPKQTGGVNELVSNTLTFLSYVIGYKDLLVSLFLSMGDGHWNQGVSQQSPHVSHHASDPSDGLSIFQHYLRDVIDALSFTIDQGGKHMKRPALQFVFLINNHSYLARALRDTMYAGDDESQSVGLGDLVGRSALLRIESQIERSRKGYIATWKALMSSFPASSLAPAEKLSMFNQGLDDMMRVQRSYDLFDADVRAMLISDATDAIVPDYEMFLRQNPDKSPEFARAMKYTPRDLQRRIKGMLDD
ncbi:exocyst complex component exo70 [Coemansia sp. RSA 2523]|nr:exocyst complex component exo70 [Coemansia sp. RSA 1591]KAJ1762608.1 exocyst complex component exo70 [Coemansia sp. RSA 1752]KAJ1777315.1 exocyst complex component exo70 [Coemansia sp. RSA 1824]KAJ1788883.1 exocyst complex component exo70 [Coemansia sp. RSA 2167]KAJ1788997.1 exocyst complex component exo70 [Coemansia sp. RSA 1938]KAJ1807563.1 exocyst complex component exo70 [Coemansia sp. RSA 2523]KAJ2132250.1 exocyst complex component exo70 [Coemansia sp. RSA 921]KAJ2138003.1 exocyst com